MNPLCDTSFKSPWRIEQYEEWLEMKGSHGLNNDTTRLFLGPWCDPVGKHMCGAIWDVEQTTVFACLQILQKMQKQYKWTGFWNEVKFYLEAQGKSAPKTIETLTRIFWTFFSKQGDSLSSVYTRRDIAARCRGAMDTENGLQRNQQGRLH